MNRVTMFWMGKELSTIEIASILSVQRVGHPIELFSYERPKQLPSGVNWFNAGEILNRENFVFFRGQNPALGTNLFRYKLMTAGRGIWLDTDVLLLKAIPETKDDLYGWQDAKEINSAVLYLSRSSPILRDLIEYTQTEYPVPPFFNKEIQKKLVIARMLGQPVHVSQMPWGVWGPLALTHFVMKNRLECKAQPVDVFYPVHYSEAHMVITAGHDVEAKISDRTLAIHLWNAMLKRSSRNRPDTPSGPIVIENGSYLEKFCKEKLSLKTSL